MNYFKTIQLIVSSVLLVGCYHHNTSEKVFLKLHPDSRMDWFSCGQTVKIHKDSIPSLYKAMILSYGDQPLTILLEGSSDHRNIESYIFTQGRDSVICLPTNGGLLGIADEEGALIMQSYSYYEGGGRYSVIEAFDLRGHRLGKMDIKLHPEFDIKQLD